MLMLKYTMYVDLMFELKWKLYLRQMALHHFKTPTPCGPIFHW